MYARHITFQYQPGKVDEALAVLREHVVPELQAIPGFQGATNLVNYDESRVVGITFWDTDVNLQGSGFEKLQARFAMIAPFLAAPPQVHVYSVTDKF